MDVKKICMLLMTVSMLCGSYACNEEYLEGEPPVSQPEGGGDEEENTPPAEEGELPPLDLSHNYAVAPIGASPSEVVLSQSVSSVNGQPFLPLAVYGVDAEEDMKKVKAWGFNLVQSYQLRNENNDENDWIAYMDAAQRQGLMVFFNLDGRILDGKKEAQIKRMVRAVKDHPALYAWYLADEPYAEEISPSRLKKMYDWIKSTDENHPILNSNWELGTFKDCCDLDMRQLYDGVPFKLTPDLQKYLNDNSKYNKPWMAILNAYDSGWGCNVEKSINPTSTFNDLIEKYGKDSQEYKKEYALWEPFFNDLEHPEAHGFKPSAAFPNTSEEIRGSFYWAFLHGSNGLFYWLYQKPGEINVQWGWYTVFHQTRLRDAIQRTIGELGSLSKYLVNPSKNCISFFDKTYPGMYVWSKIMDKRRIVIILNETGSSFNSPLDLSGLFITSRKLKVYNEDNRVIELKGDEFVDSFKKDEVHVYFVE